MFYYIDTIEQVKGTEEGTINEYGKREQWKLPLEQVYAKYYKKLSDVTTYDELDAIKAEWQDRFSKLPQEVENLISLIKLRISATLCKIGAIRETSENIRIYTPYKEFEWKILNKKISQICEIFCLNYKIALFFNSLAVW